MLTRAYYWLLLKIFRNKDLITPTAAVLMLSMVMIINSRCLDWTVYGDKPVFWTAFIPLQLFFIIELVLILAYCASLDEKVKRIRLEDYL